MAGAVVGIIVGGMEGGSVPETAKACSEFGEGIVLGILGIPTDVSSSLADGSAGEVAPRLVGAGWVSSGAGLRFVGSGMSFKLSGGWVVGCRRTADA